jgi:peptidoglycan/LPS O-acetylase OafA/YrhL
MTSRAAFTASIQGTRASQHLDLIRGLAAVAVLVYHVRYRFFLDYADVPSHDPFTVAGYLVTSFGHDAVMVFFVLSGFLIGSTVVRSFRTDRWTWTEYLTSRIVRLQVVLLPGLLLTLFWDRLGLHWFGARDIYTGVMRGYTQDFFEVSSRLSGGAFLCNAAFLQDLRCVPYGSNAALWSLSFEFWYYIVFPLLALGLVATQPMARRVACVILGAAVLFMIRGPIVQYFPIWLLGAVVALLPVWPRAMNRPVVCVMLPLGVFTVIVAATHASVVRAWLGGSSWAADLVNAVAFAGCLYLVLHDRRPAARDAYGWSAGRLSACSFSLYLVHLPLLVFLRAWLVPGRPWSPSVATLGAALVVATVAFVYALVFSRLTEANTAVVRRRVLAWLSTRHRQSIIG